MSLVAKELIGSKTADTNLAITGVLTTTASRTFFVYDDEGNVAETIDTIVLFGDLPQIGDEHPDIEFLRATKRTVSQSEARTDAYNISYSYEFMPDLPAVEISSSVSSEISSNFIDVWRSLPIAPFDFSSPGATTDISGNKIDAAGSPMSILLKQQTYQTTYEHFGSIDVSNLYSVVGKRNSASWNGFSSGYLLYLGVSFSTKSVGSFTRTDKFLYDDFAHLRQNVFAFDGDLNPALDTDGHATSVRWVQPFPETYPFSNLGIPI